MSVRVKVTATDLAAAGQVAFERAAAALFDSVFAEAQRLMGAKRWLWPRETLRRGGGGSVKEAAGSPRNIVDTGVLRASGFRQKIGRYGCQFTWAVNYAAAIHEGAVLRNGGIIEPRPWMDVVLGRIQGATSGYQPKDFEGEMEQLFIRYFKL